MSDYKLMEKCPITGDSDKIVYFNLGNIPLVNNLNDTKEESLTCPKYPLAVQLFKKSSLSTLTVEINPDILYQHYLYKSGVSLPYTEHCEEMFWFVDSYLHLKETDNVLDIGGNDGTLLKTILKKKPYLNVLNIDASENLTKEAESNGIPSLNAYWGKDIAKKLDKKFKLITTTNCFQHTAPIDSFVEGIAMSLDKFGIWCLEFPYWKTSIQTNQFDQVYHEHIYYYLLQPLKILLEKFGLRMIHCLEYPIHGGTLRLLISHKGELGKAWQPCDAAIDKFSNEEISLSNDSYIKWGEKTQDYINQCKDFILDLKAKNKTIAGFGAAAKGCIFLNAMGVNHEHIDYIIDDTNLKQGKFIPGTGIPVVGREVLKNSPQPDYIIILAHNFAEYIIKSLNSEFKGKYIILSPKITIF
jgi:hypothetical protein